jgi:hypothetical protein
MHGATIKIVRTVYGTVMLNFHQLKMLPVYVVTLVVKQYIHICIYHMYRNSFKTIVCIIIIL